MFNTIKIIRTNGQVKIDQSVPKIKIYYQFPEPTNQHGINKGRKVQSNIRYDEFNSPQNPNNLYFEISPEKNIFLEIQYC